jgi:hypothetical protein
MVEVLHQALSAELLNLFANVNVANHTPWVVNARIGEADIVRGCFLRVLRVLGDVSGIVDEVLQVDGGSRIEGCLGHQPQ